MQLLLVPQVLLMLINALYAVDTLCITMHINGIASTAMQLQVCHDVV